MHFKLIIETPAQLSLAFLGGERGLGSNPSPREKQKSPNNLPTAPHPKPNTLF